VRKKVFRVINYTLLLGIGIFLLFVFFPRSFDVPQLQKRAATKYWQLSTGSRIGYTTIAAKGEKKPFPILYLHGGPGGFISERNIQMLLPLSDDGYDIYLYDQIGSGSSDRLENIEEYTADRHKRDLEEIVKKTGSEKVILIGQSWGAILATLFLADHPEKIEKLIFTGPGPIMPIRRELADIAAPDSLHLKDPVFSNFDANQTVQNIRSRAVMFWAKTFGNRLATEKEANDFLLTLTDQTNKAMVCDTTKALRAEPGGGFYAQVMTVNSFDKIQDPRPKIKDSKVPLLLLKGQCDNQKWGFITEYLELFPNRTLVIVPSAGHGISIEQPEIYLKTIRKFLQK
jgi:proline iminopeptidase